MIACMSRQPPVLITIPVSHYCEKARWALDRAGIVYDEKRYLPAVHRFATLRRRNLTAPVLICAETGMVGESSDIIAYADARGARVECGDAEARALADDYDERLGPAARLGGYHSLRGPPGP